MVYTKIEKEDVVSKISYWESAVACYVLGASPLLSVLNGFIKRIWAEVSIEKIVRLRNGIVLVRFDSEQTRDEVIQHACYHFVSKPFIVKPQHKNIQQEKIEQVQVIHVTKQTIHSRVRHYHSNDSLLLTVVYGDNKEKISLGLPQLCSICKYRAMAHVWRFQSLAAPG
ncbi:hypothetical protein Cgig2_024071 [Carnegiea gigantea]|uniref:DUF4283 domain-containing protein n=1 Tax=Carnegiea gigantea TaxID=171969 RepID=A0A9Q1K6W8_9CARY|nr:hypothetical protein Cgig2_024071 [Carnegiea gigantea]